MPPCEWPTMSACDAPVAARTPSTNVDSCAAESATGAMARRIGMYGMAPYVRAKTQYPWSTRSGASVTQLTVPLANVPWTRMTGRGCAALGRQDQSFAPNTPDEASAFAASIGSVAWAAVDVLRTSPP